MKNKMFYALLLLILECFIVVGCSYHDAVEEGLVQIKNKNYIQALELFNNEAGTNDKAQYFLGVMFEKGLGVDKNIETAIGWYKKAAENGNVKAQYNLGVILGMNSSSYAESNDFLEAAANQNYAKAQYILGLRYYNATHFLKKNLTEAIRLVKEAHLLNSKDPQVTLTLAIMLSNENGNDNKKKGFELKKIAALLLLDNKKEYPDAQFELAKAHLNGVGTMENKTEAYYWYRIASSNGNRKAGVAVTQLEQTLEQSLIDKVKQRILDREKSAKN